MLYAIELTGAAVFAVSGVLAAGRKGLDLFGAAVIAVVAAVGGGTLRDVLLDRHPIFWIAEPAYLWAILAGTILALSYIRFWDASRRALLVVDALGLALFTVGGARLTLDTGHSGLIALLMGLITGIAGGVVRDVLTAEIPLVLRPGRLYATAAVAGLVLYLGLLRLGVGQSGAAPAGKAGIAALRFAAIRWEISLPAVRLPESGSRAQDL